MENQVSKKLMCICLRNGVEIWEEEDKTEKLQKILDVIQKSTFVHFEKMSINTADIVGIFDAKTMEIYTKRKNGEWQCREQAWHTKFEKNCDCLKDVSERRNLNYFYENI